MVMARQQCQTIPLIDNELVAALTNSQQAYFLKCHIIILSTNLRYFYFEDSKLMTIDFLHHQKRHKRGIYYTFTP